MNSVILPIDWYNLVEAPLRDWDLGSPLRIDICRGLQIETALLAPQPYVVYELLQLSQRPTKKLCHVHSELKGRCTLYWNLGIQAYNGVFG